MPKIISHRGNFEEASDMEDGRSRLRAVCQRGWGAELDLRWKGGTPYISHDPLDDISERRAEPIFKMLSNYEAGPVAVNVKEVCCLQETVSLIADAGLLGRAFLFDMELAESRRGETAKTFRRLSEKVQLAARVSDRNESVTEALKLDCCEIIWLDEFDRFWATEKDLIRLRTAGRKIYAVSGELHEFSKSRVVNRWRQLLCWGVDGICTDWCSLLETVIRGDNDGTFASSSL